MRRKIGYDLHHLPADVVAGLTGAVAGAPQAMGFAIVAGISPLYGLYSTLVATIVAALFSRSSFITVAPTNVLALVTGSALLHASDATQIERLFTITLLTGCFQIGFGVLRVGYLMRYVSMAVMTGFITGVGSLIILGQLFYLNGYRADRSINGAFPRLWAWGSHMGESNLQTSIIGFLAIGIILLCRWAGWRSIASLTALMTTSLLVLGLGWADVVLVKDIAPIPTGLPAPVFPDVRYLDDYLGVGLALALLASAQSAALSVGSQAEDTQAIVNRDLFGHGAANVVGSFFQGMPACASFSRTAVNINAGAKTRLANVFAGLTVGLILLSLGPWIERIALAALAGHLIVASSNLIRPRQLQAVWVMGWQPRLAMIITFLATWLFPLANSIYIGIVLSGWLYWRLTRQPREGIHEHA